MRRPTHGRSRATSARRCNLFCSEALRPSRHSLRHKPPGSSLRLRILAETRRLLPAQFPSLPPASVYSACACKPRQSPGTPACAELVSPLRRVAPHPLHLPHPLPARPLLHHTQIRTRLSGRTPTVRGKTWRPIRKTLHPQRTSFLPPSPDIRHARPAS